MSLATKYRPKDFDSIVGQTFVKETLKQAVKNDKIVGAYLFCGPRGTGKTSTARILAKTINCLNIQNGNPCNSCEICKSFNENKLIDIIEIDAASHTGVDNIRDIIEKAQFVPNVAKYKVYIIDEFHMLSPGASNALLKILEEPPSFVKFILATTEIQKILETILSRCQRYDFKNIDENDIRGQLEYIAKNENIIIDEKSLDFLVKNSNGGLRNAIVSFEQYIVGNEINFENIVKNSGITDSATLENFLEKLILKNPQVIDDFEGLISSGKNIRLFYKDLIYLVRDKIIEKVKSGQKYGELLQILEILDETFIKSKNSMDEKVTLLSGILKILSGSDNFIENVTNNANSVKSSKPELNEQKEVKTKISKVETLDNIELSRPENISTIEENIGVGDIEDIFGSDNLDFDNSSSIEKTSNVDFDIEKLFAELKKLGCKSSVNMAIRTGKYTFDGKEFVITPKTQFEGRSLSDQESQGYICKALENLGFPGVVLKVG